LNVCFITIFTTLQPNVASKSDPKVSEKYSNKIATIV